MLRDARKVATVGAGTADDDLVRLMTGRVFENIYPKIRFHPGETALRTANLSTSDGLVRDVSISVRRGEIVGLAGLVGSGKSELARACYGLIPVAAGSVLVDGEDLTGSAPRRMLERGFVYIPADRRAEGLVMMRSARENIVLQALRTPGFSYGVVLRRGAEKARARKLAKRLNLQPLRIERAAQHFSGGNQQKIMLAKSLTRKIGFFAFDEPTVGVDVGTRVAIYEFIRDLCENGAAVLLVSSDLPEILHLSRRVYVMCRGALSAELAGERLTQESVLGHCFGKEAA